MYVERCGEQENHDAGSVDSGLVGVQRGFEGTPSANGRAGPARRYSTSGAPRSRDSWGPPRPSATWSTLRKHNATQHNVNAAAQRLRAPRALGSALIITSCSLVYIPRPHPRPRHARRFVLSSPTCTPRTGAPGSPWPTPHAPRTPLERPTPHAPRPIPNIQIHAEH